MKINYTSAGLYCLIFYLSCANYNAQIVTQKNKFWNKAKTEMSRDTIKCNKESLLNFHCNIREKLSRTFKYNKRDGQSLIVVHNSDREEENIWHNKEVIASLNNNSYQASQNSKSVILQKKPSIFSYLSPKSSKDLMTDSIDVGLRDTNLYEALLIPKRIKKTDLERIHSYLSIKYGISLEKSKYYNSKGDVIWDPDKHKEFKKRPTGIGRDDDNELFQKQSTNQEDKILTIGREKIARTNFQNNSPLDNNNFAIWADDNKDLTFEDKEGMRILKRNWEISFIGSTVPKKEYSVQMVKNVMNPENLKLNYWMLIKDDNGTFQKIEGKEKNDIIEYRDVHFPEEKQSSIFTFATNIIDKRQTDAVNNTNPNLVVPTKGSGVATTDLQYILFPNPVKMNNHFTVKFPASEGLEISIYDGGGRILASDKISSTATTYQNKLSVQGVYLVILKQNKKLIKAFKVIVD